MNPRRINISNVVRTAAEVNAQPAVPVRQALTQLFTDWAECYSENAVFYRVIGEVPFNGVVEEAYFIPDQTIAANASQFCRLRLINAEAGDSRWPMTEYISSDAGVTVLTQIDFDEWVPGQDTVWTEPWAVNEGDLIAVEGFYVLDGTEPVWPPDLEEAFPPSFSGTVTIWFRQDGGS